MSAPEFLRDDVSCYRRRNTTRSVQSQLPVCLYSRERARTKPPMLAGEIVLSSMKITHHGFVLLLPMF